MPKGEKPYTLVYRDDRIPKTNMKHEVKDDILIRDVRPFRETLSLLKDGFEVWSMQSQMKYEDWSQDEFVKSKYLPEIESLLKKKLGVNMVDFKRYSVR